jgi:hypothetical protein
MDNLKAVSRCCRRRFFRPHAPWTPAKACPSICVLRSRWPAFRQPFAAARRPSRCWPALDPEQAHDVLRSPAACSKRCSAGFVNQRPAALFGSSRCSLHDLRRDGSPRRSWIREQFCRALAALGGLCAPRPVCDSSIPRRSSSSAVSFVEAWKLISATPRYRAFAPLCLARSCACLDLRMSCDVKPQ